MTAANLDESNRSANRHPDRLLWVGIPGLIQRGTG
jgi:hypothetical protein